MCLFDVNKNSDKAVLRQSRFNFIIPHFKEFGVDFRIKPPKQSLRILGVPHYTTFKQERSEAVLQGYGFPPPAASGIITRLFSQLRIL